MMTTLFTIPWSRVLEDAVRCRSTGTGLVPMPVIHLLTAQEWAVVRLLGRTRAAEILERWEREGRPLALPEGTRR